MAVDISKLSGKVENGGTNESGRLSASEFNLLVSAVAENQSNIGKLTSDVSEASDIVADHTMKVTKIEQLIGEGYAFMGVATADTNPGTPDQKVFYLASQNGVYPYFGGLGIKDELAIFYYNLNWVKQPLDVVNNERFINALEQIKPIVINGNVTNAPDEKDITSNEQNLLQFKNRSAVDGMGYVILRKNKTFAEQVTQESTIYEVRYDFDLNATSVVIPSNCKFISNGGSVNNGILNYNTDCLSIPEGDCKIRLNFENQCDTILPLSRLIDIGSAANIVVDADCKISNSWNTQRMQLQLYGYGHKLSFSSNVTLNTKNLSVKDVIFENVSNSVVSLNFWNSSQAFFGELQRSIVFENCTFIGIRLDMFYDSVFKNCKFINCITSVLFAKNVDLKNVENYINVSYVGCDFIAGDFNLGNNELLHINWCGWKGSVTVDRCHFFVNFENDNMLDMLDTYDSCNVKIVNSSFYTKSILRGEGILNVKSHSYSADSPLPQDLIGNKYSTIISNNTFVVDYVDTDVSSIGPSHRGMIWVRNQPRDKEDKIFQRRNVIIANNSVSIKSGGKLYRKLCDFAFVYSLTGIENLTITDNVIVSDIGFTEIFNMGECVTNTYYNNIVIKGNLLYGESNPDDNESNTLVSILYRSPKFSDQEMGEKVRNFIICDNCVYGDTSRDSSDNSPYNVFSQIQYFNNMIYNSRLNSRLSTRANIYNLDYNNKFKALPVLGKNNRCLFQGEGNNIYDAHGNSYDVDYSGSSSSRPDSSKIIKGFCYFDTTINKPIYWIGTKWVDSTGGDV